MTDEKHALHHSADRGPCFGNCGMGLKVHNDITDEKCGYTELQSFDRMGPVNRETELMGRKWFKVDEYEVYKLE